MPTSLAQLGLGAVVGACVGSASVTAAMRAARLEPFVGGRSHCDSCSTPLGYGLHDSRFFLTCGFGARA